MTQPLKFDLSLPDAALGLCLWGWWRHSVYATASDAEAEDTAAMEERARLNALTLDLDGPGEAVLEKGIRLAACEDWARAGRHLRFYLANGGVLLAAMDEAVTGRRRQQHIAKKPRRRLKPSVRVETVKAMRIARAAGSTLQQFIIGAESGEDVQIQAMGAKGLSDRAARYAVNAISVDGDKKVSHRTLEEWWAEAGLPRTN